MRLFPLLAFGALCLNLQTMNVSGKPMEPRSVDGVPGAFLIKPNGGWCWYQGPRAIVTRDDYVVFTSISGDSYAEQDGGDLWATLWNLKTGKTQHFELHDQFQRNDHAVAGLLERRDGTVLAIYGKHGNDTLQRYRITTHAGSIAQWTEERAFDMGARYTYSNVFQLSAESGRIYNFSRSTGYNPNCSISDDGGKTWRYGWRLLHWAESDYKGLSGHTGKDGGRPYLHYASNKKDQIHFVTTEDHPRAFDNSVYHGFYQGGKLHDSTGRVLSEPGLPHAKRLTPQAFTRIFEGGKDKVAWTADLELDSKGRPYIAFSVQMDGASSRGKSKDHTANDHRYWYARFDGKEWHAHEIAYAGTKLYTEESDYTGLIALDPDDPNVVVISTNADPVSGKPLVSNRDSKRHYELYRGRTSDGGKTWKWQALTSHSTVDHLRPVIPSNPGGRRVILWCRGQLTTFSDYRLDLCGIVEAR